MNPRILIGIAFFALTAAAQTVPKFEPDPYWPKPLPNNGNIWVDSRPSGADRR